VNSNITSHLDTRIVIHPKIFIQGVLLPFSSSSELMNLILDDYFIPVVNSDLLNIYSETLIDPAFQLDKKSGIDFMLKFRCLCEIVTASPLAIQHRKYLKEEHIFYSISNSSGMIPLIKPSLHYYLGSDSFRVPVYTPYGFLKKNGF